MPDVQIARVMFAAGVAVAALGLIGLPVRAGGPRLRWFAAVVTVAGVAAAVTAVALTWTAHLGPYGTVIPALNDAASDRPVPYTPVCGQAGIPVCVHPAYRSYLPDVTTALRPVAHELTGLPGAPVRAVQVPAPFEKTSPSLGEGPPTAAQLQVETIGGSPPVLRMPLNAVTLPGSFGMGTSGFAGLIRLELVHAFVGAGGPAAALLIPLAIETGAAAVGALAAGATGGALPGGILAMIRNVAGMTGVGLLSAAVLGGMLAWAGPMAYLVLTETMLAGGRTSPWVWPIRPPQDRGAALCAGLVFAAGAALITVRRVRESVRE